MNYNKVHETDQEIMLDGEGLGGERKNSQLFQGGMGVFLIQ